MPHPVTVAHAVATHGQAFLVELGPEVGAVGAHLAFKFADFPGQAFNLALVGRYAAHLGIQFGAFGDQGLPDDVHFFIVVAENLLRLGLLFLRQRGIVARSAVAVAAGLAETGKAQNQHRREGQRRHAQSVSLFHCVLPKGLCADAIAVCTDVSMYKVSPLRFRRAVLHIARRVPL